MFKYFNLVLGKSILNILKTATSDDIHLSMHIFSVSADIPIDLYGHIEHVTLQVAVEAEYFFVWEEISVGP